MVELLSSFRFRTFEAGGSNSAVAMRAAPLWRDWEGHRGSFRWVAHPERLISSLRGGYIALSYSHDILDFPAPTPEEGEILGGRIARLFCAVVQGVLVGWRMGHADSDTDGKPRLLVQLEKYLDPPQAMQILSELALDETSLRRKCREDVLSFAIERYETLGASAGWTRDELVKSGAGRFPYSVGLLNGVINDLRQEHVLNGTVEIPTVVALDPAAHSPERVRSAESTRVEWLNLFERVGRSRGWLPREGDTPLAEIRSSVDARRVWVVHGRNGALRSSIFDFLRALDLDPIEWESAVALTGTGAPYIGQVLDTAFGQARAVVVLLTGDDEARLRSELIEADNATEGELHPQPRPNVLFEAGMAFGRHPERTILVQIGRLRPFSDVAGRHLIHFTGSATDRNALATRLETAGCKVRREGPDWLTAGKFDG